MKMKLALIFSISITLFAYILSGKCGVNKLNTNPKISSAMEKSNDLRFLQEKAWEPINIFVDYKYLDSQAALVDKDKLALAKKVTENAINMYRNLLKIQKLSTKIKIADGCGDITLKEMNASLSAEGLDSDIVIFPMFDLKAEQTTEAYASPCHLEPNNNRPISGLMAFNPLNFHTEMKNDVEYYTMLVVHEINHILSFNESLFPYYVDPKTYKTLPEEKTVKNIMINGLSRKAIVSPLVVEMARKHFNCNEMEGVELENQGGAGTAGSHWDARVMLGDFMIGETYPENVLSEITLALFEDSGWYKVNYYTGGLFRYGKNKGCEFIIQTCIQKGESKFPNTFCLNANMQMCFANKMSKGACDLGIFKNDLQKEYQYFEEPKKGGYVYADYCPVAHWKNDQEDGTYFSNSCGIGKSHFKNLGEIIGSTSTCFMSSLIPKNISDFSNLQGKNRAICYPISCNEKDKTYSVKVLNVDLNCPKEGGVILNKDMDGNFYCPDYYSVCTKSAPCIDAIECALNKVEYKFNNYDYIANTQGENATLNSDKLQGGVFDEIPTPTSGDSKTLNSSRIFFNLFIFFLIVLIF